MTIRLTLILAVTAAGIVGAVTDHPHKRPRVATASVSEPRPLPRTALYRASRGERRSPLPRAPRHRVTKGRGSGDLADITMYCPTGSRNAAGRWPRLGDVAALDRTIPFGTRVLIAGNVYYVEDWIGFGATWDLFGGNDAGCEQRALNFGRQRLRVVVG